MSPLMDGHSRWNILSDTKLSAVLPEVFLPAPEIVPGFLQDEVEAVFHNWNPLIWQVIKARGVFVGNIGEDAPTLHPQSFATRLTRLIKTFLIDRIRQV